MPIQRERLLDDLLELVRIPSPSLREGMVAQAVISRLKEVGADVEVDTANEAIGGEHGNIIARIDGNLNVPALLLNAHIDTVTPCENVVPVVECDCIRSNGETILGADDKAGVCIILEALRVLREDKVAHGPIEVVFTIAEEIGLLGAKHLDYSRLTAKCGFVFDGGAPVSKVVVAAPTQKNIRAKIRGIASHAGVSPEKGVNAIVLASRAIAKMRLGRIDDETTANIGVIRGGRATNIVPDLVELHGEARSHDERKLDEQIEHMRSLLIAEAEQGGGSAEVEVELKYRSFMVGEDELPAIVVRVALERLGETPVWKRGGGGSDANIFNERGIRSVIVSSAEQNAHMLSEFVCLSDMERATQLAIELVRSFASVAGS
ncbi:MAG: hypothetical protein GDYSWBUE_002031 [Candidatus Fervidibacterota bacterium]